MWMIKKFFGSSVIALYAGEAVFTVWAFVYFIQNNVKKEYWIFAAFLFLTSGMFFTSMNTSRQYVAIGFLLFSLEQLKSKKYIPCLIGCLLACLFHSSAVVVLLFFLAFLWYQKSEEKQGKILKIVNLFVVISLVVAMFDIRNLFVYLYGIMNKISFLKRFTWYFETGYFLQRNKSAFLKYVFPDLLWFYIYYFLLDKLRKKSVWTDCYLLMFALGLIIGNCFYGINVLVRISWYFEVAVLPLMPLVVEAHESRENRYIVKMILAAYYLCHVIYIDLLLDSNYVVPYHTIFYM
jgi:hypothetical protein